MPETNVAALVDALLRANPSQMRRMLEGPQGRLLLHPMVEAALRDAVRQAADRGEKRAEQFFAQHARLLARCREHGVAAAFAALSANAAGEASALPDDPNEALAELQRLQGTTDPRGLARHLCENNKTDILAYDSNNVIATNRTVPQGY